MGKISIEELRENFDYFDSDGDGRLELGEFVHLMEALDALGSAEEATIGFRALDADGSGRVEFDEFSLWFTSR